MDNSQNMNKKFATNEDSRMVPARFFTILRLEKWIPDGRLLSENLFPKQAISKTFTRNSIELSWKQTQIYSRYLTNITETLSKNLPLFDWRYIKSSQIGIRQLSGCVILNLWCHLSDSRMKWYQGVVNPNPILFYRKINFPLLIFQRWAT